MDCINDHAAHNWIKSGIERIPVRSLNNKNEVGELVDLDGTVAYQRFYCPICKQEKGTVVANSFEKDPS
jgi:hypothetical protein